MRESVREVMKAGARGGLPGGRQEAMTALAVDERCIVGERRWWQLMKADDVVVGASR